MRFPRHTFDAFLSHNWGMDNLGRDNHDRVAAIGRMLRDEYGFRIWLDEDQLNPGDHLLRRLTNGVAQSALFVVFITQAYIDKAGGNGPNGTADNVFHEFNAACLHRKIIIPIVMERDIDWSRDSFAATVLYPLFRMYFLTDDNIARDVETLADCIRQRLAAISPMTMTMTMTIVHLQPGDPTGVAESENAEEEAESQEMMDETMRSRSRSRDMSVSTSSSSSSANEIVTTQLFIAMSIEDRSRNSNNSKNSWSTLETLDDELAPAS